MARCQRCSGQKKVMGLGWIEIDCPSCNGTGVNTIINGFGVGEEPMQLAETLSKASDNTDYRPTLNRSQRAKLAKVGA